MSPYIIFILIFFIFITILYWGTNISDNKKVSGFTSIISTCSIFILFFSFIDGVNSRKDESKKKIKESNNDNWMKLEHMFKEEYPYLTKLYREIYSANKNIPQCHEYEKDISKSRMKEQHACQIMYQIIEDIIDTKCDIPINQSWQNVFSSWSKSNIFKHNWKYSKHFYEPTTQKFVDNLIYNNSIK
jgi:hypothetical protein